MKPQPNFTQFEIKNLQTAYEEAIYEVYADHHQIQLKIGEICSELDDLMLKSDRSSWALITAFNPYSQCLTPELNHQRHQELKQHLQGLSLELLPAVGKDPDGVWTPEKSILILGITSSKAIAIGHQFEQNAVVYGELYQPTQLLWLV